MAVQVTEEQLAVFFKGCGEVVDCRVCGDPNSAMRFAFVEFSTEQAAEAVSFGTPLPCIKPPCLFKAHCCCPIKNCTISFKETQPWMSKRSLNRV